MKPIPSKRALKRINNAIERHNQWRYLSRYMRNSFRCAWRDAARRDPELTKCAYGSAVMDQMRELIAECNQIGAIELQPNITVERNPDNPNRLDVTVPAYFSFNCARIKEVI